MITTEITTNKSEFLEMLNGLKVKGKHIFNPDEANYLADCTAHEAVDFKQENESDDEFLKQFSIWLHERPKRLGHVDYYILVYHRMGEKLTSAQFEYMERNVAECFDTSHGWLYEINHRMRFHLRIQLICSNKDVFRRLTKKDWAKGEHA